MKKYTANTDYGVEVQRHITERREPEHDHDFIEIVYIAGGKAVQIVNDKSYPVKRGDLLFINYGCVHAFVPESRFTYYNILLKPEFISETLINSENAFELLSLTAFEEFRDNVDTEKALISFDCAQVVEIENIVKGMYNEAKEMGPAFKTVIKGYVTVLIAKILRKLNITTTELGLDETWSEIVDYINSNISEKLTLQEIAGKCFYNPSYFSRIFKEKFGTTLIDYIAKTRVNTAAKLLDSTSLTINEISEKCGFSNKVSFYRTFQKYYNQTPSEYRKK